MQALKRRCVNLSKPFDEEFVEKVRTFVENGGTLVTTYWSGIVDDTDLCKMGGLPGDMMDVFGV